MRRTRNGGFTLIEILVVVAIIGILATLAIVNYQSALLRARQKRTMADMRAIAVAWEARAVDQRRYNAAGFTIPAMSATYAEMAVILTPTYMRGLPTQDGWGHAYGYSIDAAVGSTTPAEEYVIRSPGRDGQFDGTTYTPGPNDDPDTDIVFSAGSFVVWPEKLAP